MDTMASGVGRGASRSCSGAFTAPYYHPNIDLPYSSNDFILHQHDNLLKPS